LVYYVHTQVAECVTHCSGQLECDQRGTTCLRNCVSWVVLKIKGVYQGGRTRSRATSVCM